MRKVGKGIHWRWLCLIGLAACCPCRELTFPKHLDSIGMHDIGVFSVDIWEGSSFSQLRLEVIGLGYGNQAIDVYSGFNIASIEGRRLQDTSRYFGISSFASLFSAVSASILSIDKVKGWTGDDVAKAIIFAPYLFYPEVRFFPGSWVYPYLGSNLDIGIEFRSGRRTAGDTCTDCAEA